MRYLLFILLFCSLVFAGDEVWFIGGSSSSATNGGGFSKDFWTSSGDIDNVMGADGAALTLPDNSGEYNSGSGVISNINVGSMGDSDGLVGCYVYINFEPPETDTRQQILASTSTSLTVDVSLADTGTQAYITIGGAIDTLENAIANGASSFVPTCGTDGNRYILLNENQVEGTDFTDQLVLGIGGNHEKNYWLNIIGYNTTPPSNASMDNGDLDYGGADYEGAIGAYEGETASGWIAIDGDDTDHDLVDNSDEECVRWRNIKFHNVDPTDDATDDTLYSGAADYYIAFENCYFDESRYHFYITSYNWSFTDCYFGDNYNDEFSVLLASTGQSSIINRCIFKFKDGDAGNYFGSYLTDIIIVNSLFDGGDYALYLYDSYKGLVALNCTFIDQTNESIMLARSWLYASGNIFYPRAASDNAIDLNNTELAAVLYNDWNCAYSVAGALSDAYPDFQESGNNIEVDPDFVDAANGDFTPQNTNLQVVPDGFGNAKIWMGAVQKDASGGGWLCQ